MTIDPRYQTLAALLRVELRPAARTVWNVIAPGQQTMTDDDLIVAVLVGLGLLALASVSETPIGPSPGPPEPIPQPPPIDPAPPTNPPTDPAPGTGTGDPVDVVRNAISFCASRGIPVRGSEQGAWEITKRVAWHLRSAGWGLLEKVAGENIIDDGGVSYSLSRLCSINGSIVKILGDCPTTNNPEWNDDGTMADAPGHVKGYRPPIDPGETF